jgi:hypothetical protein
MTSPLDNTGPMQSEQIKQCPSLPILNMRMKTNVWPTNTAILKIILIGSWGRRSMAVAGEVTQHGRAHPIFMVDYLRSKESEE